PIAMVRPGFPALLIEAAGPTLGDMRALAGRLTALGARVVVLTDGDRRAGEAEEVVRLRTGLPEVLTPIPFAVAGQLLALGMAVRLGVDPARPRGLPRGVGQVAGARWSGPGLGVGPDGGGSRSRGRLCEGGRVLVEAEAGAANATAVGDEPAERELGDLLDRLCGASGRDAVVAACAGVAGADSPVGRERAQRCIRRLLPAARVLVVHDARLVLAAARLGDGI